MERVYNWGSEGEDTCHPNIFEPGEAPMAIDPEQPLADACCSV